MMDTSLFLFGIKLHREPGSVEFFDADFSNTLDIKSIAFNELTLGECCKIINEALKVGGFSGKGLSVGLLKDIDNYDLAQILVRRGKVSLRFNSFT